LVQKLDKAVRTLRVLRRPIRDHNFLVKQEKLTRRSAARAREASKPRMVKIHPWLPPVVETRIIPVRNPKRNLNDSKVRGHWLEPFRTRSDYCVVRKKFYKKGVNESPTGCGIEFLDPRSLNTAKVLKGTFDVLTLTRIMISEESQYWWKSAKRVYQSVQSFFSKREDVFGTSKFVRQMLGIISITMRITHSTAMPSGRPHRGNT